MWSCMLTKHGKSSLHIVALTGGSVTFTSYLIAVASRCFFSYKTEVAGCSK